MAQSRFSSNTPDWRDVVTFLLELEKISGGYVSIRMRPAGTQGRQKLHLTAELLADDPNQAVVRTLASASVSLPGNSFGGLEPALLLLGYELDKDYYRRSEGLTPQA